MNEAILNTESETKTYRKMLDYALCFLLSVVALTLVIAGVACILDASILSGIFYLIVGALIMLLVIASKSGRLMSYLEM